MPPRKRKKNHRDSGYKILRLCGQVAKTLNYALAGVCNDDILRELYVTSVVPSSNSSQLLVTVSPQLQDISRNEIFSRLELHMNTLRMEVANSINRCKVPQLKFDVVDFHKLES